MKYDVFHLLDIVLYKELSSFTESDNVGYLTVTCNVFQCRPVYSYRKTSLYTYSGYNSPRLIQIGR